MLHIDYKSGLPIYEQICQGIVCLAAAGAFGEEGQLPSVRSVAQELGVNPNTVQKAYSLLEHEGLICSVPGRGSFLTGEEGVVKHRQEEALKRLRGMVKEALGCGCSPESVQEAAGKAIRSWQGTQGRTGQGGAGE